MGTDLEPAKPTNLRSGADLTANVRFRIPKANVCFCIVRAYVQTVRNREEFRAPAGVRKSPRKEPAGHRRISMGISSFG